MLAALATVAAAATVAAPADAAPAFRSVATAVSSSSVKSITVSRPSAVVAGDVLVAALDVRFAADGTITPPSGWTLVRRDSSTGAAALSQAVYTRVAGSFEPPSYTWSFSKYRYAAIGVAAYGGVDTAAPVVAHSGQIGGSSSSIVAPSVSGAPAGALVLGVFGSDGAGSVTPPAGTSERFDVATKAGSSAVKLASADAVQATAGATGDKVAASSAVHEVTAGQLVVLRPAGSTAPPPPGDTSPPTTPTGLAVSGTTQTSVSVSWNASTDDVGVSGYGLYVDGAPVGSTTSRTYTFGSLSCGMSYTLGVDAYDAAGNRSAKASVTASTAACSTPPPSLGAALPAPLAASTGTTFYVATTGSDSNPGTLASPWRTIQKALNTLAPGQRALVRAGTYDESLVMNRAGTATSPITVEAYPGEKPIVDATTTHALRVNETGAYFRFKGFVIQGFPGTSGGNVDVYGHHIEISNNEIRGSTDQGIYTDEASYSDQFLNNWVHHNGQGITHQSHGFYLQGNDHLVLNNVIHDHPEGFGIQVYDRNSRSIIAGNTVVASGHSGIVVGGSGGVDNIRVIGNVFAFNAHYGISHDSTCPTSSRAEANVVFGNAWGGTQGGCSGLTYSGNSTADPLFVNYSARDLHVQAGSPAIDSGIADYARPYDFEGRARPQGAAVDRGAFER